jgi:hypothetical protein
MAYMKAIVSQERKRVRGRRIVAVVFCASLMGVGEAGAAEQEMTAVLKLQEFTFVYRSTNYVLSCGDIRARVATVLQALGAASQDMQVRVNGCDTLAMPIDRRGDTLDGPGTVRSSSGRWSASVDPFEHPYDDLNPPPSNRLHRRTAVPIQSTHVDIRALLPVELTAKVQAELQKDKSRRELISRVNPSSGIGEPVVFAAERRVVELSRKTIRLEPEECELMEQMARSVFKKIGARVVRRASCPDEPSNIPPKLMVEALLPKLPNVPTLSTEGEETKPTEPPDSG